MCHAQAGFASEDSTFSQLRKNHGMAIAELDLAGLRCRHGCDDAPRRRRGLLWRRSQRSQQAPCDRGRANQERLRRELLWRCGAWRRRQACRCREPASCERRRRRETSALGSVDIQHMSATRVIWDAAQGARSAVWRAKQATSNAALRPNDPRPFGLPPNAAPASLRSSPREPPLASSRASQSSAFGGNASHAVNVNRPYGMVQS